jgi:hypothetical protein
MEQMEEIDQVTLFQLLNPSNPQTLKPSNPQHFNPSTPQPFNHITTHQTRLQNPTIDFDALLKVAKGARKWSLKREQVFSLMYKERNGKRLFYCIEKYTRNYVLIHIHRSRYL